MDAAYFKKDASFFVRLDCKPGNKRRGDIQPWSRSFVDDELQWDHPKALKRFHKRSPPATGRSRVDCFTDSLGEKHHHRLMVETTTEHVLGQSMFVVDVEFTQGSNTLDVPKRPEGRS